MDQRQYEVMLADAELRLRRLRTLYDHWFHGLERTEPQQQRADVEKLIAELRRQPQRNTALRFRFNQLVQRYTTFNTYWQRIARQIEEGTYKRDVLRARQRVASSTRQNPRESQAAPGDRELDMDVDVDVDAALAALKTDPPPAAATATPADGASPRSSSEPPSGERRSPPPRAITPFALPAQQLPVIKPPVAAPSRAAALAPPPAPAGVLRKPAGTGTLQGVPQRPAPPLPAGALGSRVPVPPPVNHAPRAAAGGGGNGMSEDQIQRIYQRYVEARRQNAERTDNVRLETVAKTVRDMLPKLAEKHAGKSIDFEVVLKDGRVALKPVAK